MKNKALIMTNLDICYTGEVCFGETIDNGIVLKQSDKSDIKIWLDINEIKKIILPDATSLEGNEIKNVFNKLKYIIDQFELEK